MKTTRLVVLVLVAVVACTAIVVVLYWDPHRPPERPQNVPTIAIWYGGVDGGDWIFCSPTDSVGSVFQCTVFSDYDGSELARGRFQLNNGSITVEELRQIISYYSGEYIHLNDGRFLHPVDKAGSD